MDINWWIVFAVVVGFITAHGQLAVRRLLNRRRRIKRKAFFVERDRVRRAAKERL